MGHQQSPVRPRATARRAFYDLPFRGERYA